jgi:hypothetical protein
MSLNARRRPLVTVGVQRINDQFLRSKIGPFNNQISAGPQAAAIRIIVTPTLSGRKWLATFDGAVLCTSSSPLVISARILLARAFDPARTVEMWHANATTWALRGRLGPVAATLIDGEKATRPAKNRVLARFPATPAAQPRQGGRAQ